MGRLRLVPYTVAKGKMNSISCRSISRHFDGLQVWPNRNYVPKDGDVIINWGYSGDIPFLRRNNANVRLLNTPEAISNASNKIKCLKALKSNGIAHIAFSETKEDAEEFIEKGYDVYCRTLINAREGKGIVVAKTKSDLVDAKLYTRQFASDTEFRVHVFNGEIIDVVEKQRMKPERMAELGIVEADLSDDVRNRKKGWIFNRKDVAIPNKIEQIAIDGIKAMGLDFGAVDIIHNTKNNQSAILEINTAPGMARKKGSWDTHYRYVRAIQKFIDNTDLTENAYELKYNCKLKYGRYKKENQQ